MSPLATVRQQLLKSSVVSPPLVIITGLSGSGKSTALNVFEDMDFFMADGVPLHLIGPMVQLFSGSALAGYQGFALGVDLRHIAKHADTEVDYLRLVAEMKSRGFTPQIIFLEAKAPVLMRRYATTRRPHPLEKEGFGLEQALAEERSRLDSLRNHADLVIDTSTFSVHDLRRVIQNKWKSLEKSTSLRLHLISFGFKYGTPSEADMVFDLRFLPNPYFVSELRPFSGKDPAVRDYVLLADPGKTFLERLRDFLSYVLQQNEHEGRFRLTIAIGCTGGRHRSVAVTENLFHFFSEQQYTCSVEHRHLELG